MRLEWINYLNNCMIPFRAKDYNKISDVLADMSVKLQLDISEMDEDEKRTCV